jgi:hypothetical protein
MALTDASTGSIGEMWIIRNVRFMPMNTTRANCPKRFRICRRKVLMSGGRILRLRRKIPLLFGEKGFETVCFDSFFLNGLLNRRAVSV